MLTAGGRAPPFGDLAKCATAAGADAGAGIQSANLFAWGWQLPTSFRTLVQRNETPECGHYNYCLFWYFQKFPIG